MPAYNVEKYIEEAVNSILYQSFPDFELLILNDGSIDRTSEIINSINDERIRFFDDIDNQGKIYRLNQGLSKANGKYITIMDADDISLPSRLYKQYYFLEANSEIGACGSWIELFGEKKEIIRNPTLNEEIYLQLLNGCCFAMPLIRKDIIDKFCLQFELDTWPEDYLFWVKLIEVTKLYSLPEVLYYYRIHKSQISQCRKVDISEGSIKVKNYHFNNLCNRVFHDEVPQKPDLYQTHKLKLTELIEINNFMNRIFEVNMESKEFNQQLLELILSKIWYRSFFSIDKANSDVIKYFIYSTLMRKRAKLTIKSYLYFTWFFVKHSIK